MLTVVPIRSKSELEFFCAKCNIPYDIDLMAYSAHVDGAFVGMCQFGIKGERGYIKNIVSIDGVDDFEAMFIMGRATMNFIDLCGVHTCECAKDAGQARLLTAIGFKDIGSENLFVDMTGMFDGHCSGHNK